MELNLSENQVEEIKGYGEEGYSLRKMSSLFAKNHPSIFTTWLKDYYDGRDVDYDYFLRNGHQVFGMALMIEAKCVNLFMDFKD